MGGIAKSINVEKAIALGDDLISVLSIERESDVMTQCLEGAETLRSSWESVFCEVQSSIEGFHQRIEVCKQQIKEANNQTVATEELDRLQQDLEEELTNEKQLLDELREIGDVIEELESKRISIEKQSEDKKKREKDEVRMQNMLCMCTQVTRIIPDLENKAGISGHIVDGDKKRFEKFQFESAPPSFEICNKLWKMLES